MNKKNNFKVMRGTKIVNFSTQIGSWGTISATVLVPRGLIWGGGGNHQTVEQVI